MASAMAGSEQPRVRRFLPPARFRVPAPPPAFVPRPQLVDRLDRSPLPLTVVVGSPGAGKTALVGSWVEQRSGPTVWLSCDPTDADPVRFWSALALALEQSVPGAGLEVLQQLDEQGRESFDVAMGLAVGCDGTDDLVVVIDDFHLAGSAPAVFAAFVRGLPPEVRLVLLTRQDPSFPVGRLRVQGRLLEVRDRDLALSLPEARRLFDELGVEVEPDDLLRLRELTEGWAAGLHLAALSLAGRPDRVGFVKEFADSDRGVSDFLVNEVLDLQGPDVADFLMRSSVLDSFDAALCAAVTGRADAGDLLRRLHDEHLFLVELDRRHGWYRYHHLFGSFLRGRLLERSPARLRAAHAAAAQAYADRGDLMSAVSQAMAADDVEGAFRLVREVAVNHSDVESRQVAVDIVRGWLRQHGAAHLDAEPRLVLECCLILAAVGALGELDVWLDRVEQRIAAGPVDPGVAALHAAVWGLHLLHQGDPDAALGRVDEALRHASAAGSTEFWVSQWPVVAAQAHFWRDDPAAAAATLVEARRAGTPSTVFDLVRAPGLTAWAAAVEGELVDAEAQARFALESADSLDLPQTNLGRVFPLLALAVVAFDRDDLDEAERLATAALASAEVAGRPPSSVVCLLVRARLAWARGSASDATAWLDRAHLAMPRATAVVLDHVQRIEARIAVDLGRPDATARVHALRPTAQRDLLGVRLLLDTRDPGAAVRSLDRVETGMTTRRLRVEHRLLRARAAAGSDRAAAEHVAEAARLAQAVGLVRPFLDEEPYVRGALELASTDPHLAPFVGRVLDAGGSRPAVGRPGRASSGVDGLSDRETDVLRYLASRLSYPEVARELYISVNTLKSHVKAVYRKLDASSREEAVQTARRTGLL